MNERLQELMTREQLSSARLADLIGVQRSSISHILSGRNKPSYDFLMKMLDAFPGLQAEWLLRGKGSMFTEEDDKEPGIFDSSSGEENNVPAPEDPGSEDTRREVTYVNTRQTAQNVPQEEAVNAGRKEEVSEKRIVRVMLFYEDKTFTSYVPDH